MCLFPQKDLRPPSEAVWCWAQAAEGGNFCTRGTFAALSSRVMCVQGDQQAPYQTLLVMGRGIPGVTEQRKHRRQGRVGPSSAFLLSGHLLAASVAHRIQ